MTPGHMDIAASREQFFIADSGLAVESSWPQFADQVKRLARWMTDDRDERKDLVQEALIALWMADPTRFDLDDRYDRGYLRRILRNRMWHVWDRERNRFRAMTPRVGEWVAHPDAR